MSRHAIKMSAGAAEFLAATGCGISVIMASNDTADDIGDGPDDYDVWAGDPGISYVRDHLLVEGESAVGLSRWWFDEEKLCALLSEKKNRVDVGVALLALSKWVGVNLRTAMDEGGMEPDMLSDGAKKLYLKALEGSGTVTFEDIFVEPEQVRVKRRWRAVKFAFIMLIFHGRAVVSANHPKRKKARMKFETS